MKIKNKVKTLICAFVFFFASICLAVVNVAAAETTSFEMQSVINEYYAFGTEFSVPNAEFVSGGNRYKAYTVVYDPDQEVITDKTFTLSKKGEYRISYSATIDSKQHREVYSFNSADLSADAFTVVNNAKITSGANTPDYYCLDSTGLKVTATADGGNVNYSKVIDLSGNTKKDNLLTLGVIPREEGVEDLWQITITLTDIYDSTNKVRIVTYRGSWGKAYCFTRAAAKGQALAGYDHTKKVLQTEYRMGTGATHSFTGANEAGFGSLSYAYDYAEKAVYVAGSLVVDFDSSDYFIESLLWDGFTTGEVTLNVSLEKLKAAEADIMIFNVNGNDLTKKVIDDKQAPIIDIDFGEYENQDLPKGEVGKAYSLFPAKAYDRCQGAMKQTDVVTTIYKNYNTPTQEVVANNVIQFMPTSAGEYYVQYACTDANGNTRYDGYTLIVESSIETMKLVGFDLQESYYVGEEIVFPIANIEGGSGIPAVKTFLRDKSGNAVLENPESWLPKTAGEYEFVVSAVDYLGDQFEQVFAFEMLIKDEPIIKVGYVPKYLFSKMAYTFKDFEAIDYSSSSIPQEASKKIIVSYAGKETELSVGDSYTPEIQSGYDKLNVKYYAESVDGSHSDYVEREIHLIDPYEENKLDYAALFVGGDVNIHISSRLHISFNKNTEISYVNPLIANNFAIWFDIDKQANNFQSIVITLTDSVDSNIAVSLTIGKGNETEDTSSLRMSNDSRIYAVQGSFFDTTTNMFKLSYNKNVLSIKDETASAMICSLKQTVNGTKFEGFPSGKIYVSMAFKGVTGDSAIYLSKISNQSFNGLGLDLLAPELDLAESIKTLVGINDVVKVPQAYVADGIDPSATVTVTVSQGKNVLYSNVDVSEKGFEFVADSYQTYKVMYVVKDWRGNFFDKTIYSIYVQDEEPPILNVEWNVMTAKKGDKVTLPVATAMDNNDKDLSVEVYVYYPRGDCRIYKDKTLTFSEKGTYEIVFLVRDLAGNYAKKTFKVVVS